jgi:hypothetical protein
MSNLAEVRMNTRNMSDTEILDLFEKSFNSQIAELNDFDDPEFELERIADSNNIRVLASLYGMAGSPTADTYKDAENVASVDIYRADKGTLRFHLVSDEIRALGGNEYQVTYESE